MKKKILIFATSQLTIESFLLSHIQILKKKYDVVILTKFTSSKKFFIKGTKIYNINIDRKINIFNDLKNLIYILSFLKLHNFNLVFTITPKAGLLGMIAAYLNNVPVRIHIFTGQVWSGKKYFSRFILKYFDRLIANLSTETLCDSLAQKKFLIKNYFSKKIKVIRHGSVCGINTKKFTANITNKIKLRKKFKIDKNEIIFLYVGRINKDKGIYNLIKVFKLLDKHNYKIKFFLIGMYEDEKLKLKIKKIKGMKHIKHTKNVSKYYQFADVFITSSYREGFGISVAEAMSSNLPIIGTSIYGLKDLLKNQKNSLTHKVDDIDKLFLNCKKLIGSKKLRQKLGTSGRNYIVRKFNQEKVVRDYLKFFNSKMINV